MPPEIFHNDADYRLWLETNPDGFVLNTRRIASPDYMMLHRASCPYISEPSHESEPGGFTERQYIKVGAPDVATLQEWVAANGRPDGSFSNECSRCRPMG